MWQPQCDFLFFAWPISLPRGIERDERPAELMEVDTRPPWVVLSPLALLGGLPKQRGLNLPGFNWGRTRGGARPNQESRREVPQHELRNILRRSVCPRGLILLLHYAPRGFQSLLCGTGLADLLQQGHTGPQQQSCWIGSLSPLVEMLQCSSTHTGLSCAQTGRMWPRTCVPSHLIVPAAVAVPHRRATWSAASSHSPFCSHRRSRRPDCVPVP